MASEKLSGNSVFLYGGLEMGWKCVILSGLSPSFFLRMEKKRRIK